MATKTLDPKVITPPEADSKIIAPPQVSTFAVPTSIASFLDPDAKLATAFKGPVISGDYAKDGVPGIAMLHKRAKIDFTYGNFSIPVKFPPSAILTQYMVQIQQSYNGTLTKINLGTALNGVDIANVDVTVAPTQLLNNITGILGSTWTIYLSQVLGAGNTQGKATVMIFYSAPAQVRFH
jgi:hypothetical protein